MSANAPSPLRRGYLVLYNAISAAAWSTVLYRTVTTWTNSGHDKVYYEVGEWTKWTQTAAAMEILHSILGIVRAPLLTTVMQVASRFLLVWGIMHPYYPLLSHAPSYATMLIAWSVTEVIRYSFFATGLMGICPSVLIWLRYNTFFLLYPIGIISECSLIYLTSNIVGAYRPLEQYILYAILLIYIPGSYTLYTYMMAQRQKVLYGGVKEPKA